MKKIVPILLISLLILTGCKVGSVSKSDRTGDYDYRTGTEGLVMSFPVEMPTKMYEGDSNVKSVVEIQNKGAYPQTGTLSASFWITGYDTKIITIALDSGNELNTLMGKNQYNTEGDLTAIGFDTSITALPDGVSYFTQNLQFTLTYGYETLANPIVCIDTEPRGTTVRNKVCTVQDVSLSSQGGPVAVKKVEQDVASDKILFKILVENVGGGMVIAKDDVSKNPDEGYDWNKINKVTITANLGSTALDCKPTGDIKLTNNKGYIYCSIQKSTLGTNVYTTPLNIKVDYGYSISTTKKIDIFDSTN
ncbi:MAG: hypothetical protein ABIC04_05605 [Nanoarchaeota archaeon]